MRFLLLFALLALAPQAHAIIWCHDYTTFRLTGVDPRPLSWTGEYGVGMKELRDWLTAEKYNRFDFSNAVKDPEKAERYLKPGYVIVIRDDHSGIVDENGRIDHFIQLQGEVGKKRDVNALPDFDEASGKIGGLYSNETLRNFLKRPYRQDPMTVEVWRK